MEEIKMLYQESLENKIKVELCYKVIEDNYTKYRLELYKDLKVKLFEMNKNVKEIYDSFTSDQKINLMFNNYKEMVVRFMLYKNKFKFLIENSKSLISDEHLEKMVEDQNEIMKFVEDINNKIPESKLIELNNYISEKNILN